MNLSFTHISRRGVVAAMTFLAIAAVIAALTTSTADSATPAPGVTASRMAPFFPAAAAPEQAAAAQAGFTSHFATLQAPAVAIPAASVIKDPGVERFAAHEIAPTTSAALAQAGASAPKARLWAAPRDDGTQCLLAQPADAQGPAELCATLAQADDGYLLMTQSTSDADVDLYGLLPDGVSTVTVTFGDGTSATLPVVANAYAAHFAKPTAAISFTDASGGDHRLLARSAG